MGLLQNMRVLTVKTYKDYYNDPDLVKEPSALREVHAGQIVIETNLTADEKAVIKAGRKERKEHPENFTPWATIKAKNP